MVKILHSDAQPNRLPALLALFKTKWPHFERTLLGDDFPSPLLLLSEAGALVGGLSFTTAQLPQDLTHAVWINAVMVRPHFQRRGFASQLVDQGCQVAKVYGAGRLYVYTDVPTLYAKLGWEAVTSDSGGSVFTKAMI